MNLNWRHDFSLPRCTSILSFSLVIDLVLYFSFWSPACPSWPLRWIIPSRRTDCSCLSLSCWPMSPSNSLSTNHCRGFLSHLSGTRILILGTDGASYWINSIGFLSVLTNRKCTFWNFNKTQEFLIEPSTINQNRNLIELNTKGRLPSFF